MVIATAWIDYHCVSWLPRSELIAVPELIATVSIDYHAWVDCNYLNLISAAWTGCHCLNWFPCLKCSNAWIIFCPNWFRCLKLIATAWIYCHRWADSYWWNDCHCVNRSQFPNWLLLAIWLTATAWTDCPPPELIAPRLNWLLPAWAACPPPELIAPRLSWLPLSQLIAPVRVDCHQWSWITATSAELPPPKLNYHHLS